MFLLVEAMFKLKQTKQKLMISERIKGKSLLVWMLPLPKRPNVHIII